MASMMVSSLVALPLMRLLPIVAVVSLTSYSLLMCLLSLLLFLFFPPFWLNFFKEPTRFLSFLEITSYLFFKKIHLLYWLRFDFFLQH
jgi:hypothetical protein